MTNTWTKAKIIDFLNDVQAHSELWKVDNINYRDKIAKKYGWDSIASKFGITSDEAYKKFRSLRTYAQKHAQTEEKKRKSGRRGAGGSPRKWFASDAISFIWTLNGTDNSVASIKNEEEIDETSGNETNNQTTNQCGTNKKRKLPSNFQADFFKVCTDNLTSTRNLSESDIIGMNIAKKLAKMNQFQAIYAESIINNVLRRGLLNKLSESTDVCDSCHQMSCAGISDERHIEAEQDADEKPMCVYYDVGNDDSDE